MDIFLNEKIYRAIGESFDFGVWVCNPDGRNIYASDSFLSLVGITQKECSDFGWTKFLHPEDSERTISAWKECVRIEGVWEMEHRFRGLDGRWHPVLARGVPVRDARGRLLYWAGIYLDISRLKSAEEALVTARTEASNDKNRLLAVLEALPVGLAIVDAQGGTVHSNPGYEKIWGDPRPTVRRIDDYSAFQAWWADSGQLVQAGEWASARAVLNGEIVIGQEIKIRRFDGSHAFVLNSAAPIRDAEGRITGSAVAIMDVSTLKEVELALKKLSEELELRVSERTEELSRANLLLNREIEERKKAEHEREQFQKFFQTSADIMVIADPNGSFLRTNPACKELLGYSEEELLSKPFMDFVHPDDRESTASEMARQLKTGSSSSFENRYIRKDGSFLWLSWIAVYNKDKDCTYATARDITGKKQREDALRRSEQEFRLLAEAMPQIVWITRPDGWNIYFNQQWMDYTGMTLEESMGHGWNRPFHTEDRQIAWDAWQNATKNVGTYSIECRLRRRDGVYKWWLIRGVPVLDEHGAVLKWFGTCTDIDEFKKGQDERLSLERQLLHTQKLESLGVLAGGIAHDFNNILMAIIGNTDLALMNLAPDSPVTANLKQIEQAAMRAADLAKQMLAYSGRGKFLIESLDLNRLLEEMMPMLEVSISKKALLRLNLTPHIPPIEADATQIRQIIMNLVINASEALLDESGVITITTGSMICDKSRLNEFSYNEGVNEGVYVYLEIIDTGCGMDNETIGRIFDPFFTTKFIGRGLGMSAVHGIIRGHKGAVDVRSEPGRGTSFKVLLPAAFKPAEIQGNVSNSDYWQGNGTVLLVDDEELVRDVATDLLKALGFNVITAKDGLDAVAIFKSRDDIDVVILDLTMPHMDGEQCFQELQQIDPKVKIIISSGYSEQEVISKFPGNGLAGFIQKPYNLSEIKKVLRSDVTH